MSKVYVYTRNSNAEAFEKGSSRETQIKKCTNYASIKDLTLIYVGVPLMETGLTVKVGVQTATLQTTETLATGSTYKDVDMEGASVGLYYDGAITDNLFYRLEGAYTYFDDMSTTGSEVGGTAGTFNKITAELTGVAAKASIGFKF